jgi:hypothetical protein
LTGQEYCRLVFTRRAGARAPSYGLLFVMDRNARTIVEGSVECF